jgi:hypothetical protein
VVAEAGAFEGGFQVSFLYADVHESPIDYIAEEVGAGLVFDLGESDSVSVHCCVLVDELLRY